MSCFYIHFESMNFKKCSLDAREFSRTAPTGFRPVEIVGDRLKSYKSVPTARTFLWVNGAVNGQTLFSGRILPAKPRGLVLGSRVSSAYIFATLQHQEIC